MKLKLKTSITIDPGISGTGYAIWNQKWNLLLAGGIYEPRVHNWMSKGRAIAVGIFRICKKYRVNKVYIEFPRFMQSIGGQVTAKSGALVKLCWMVGFLSAVLMDKKQELIEVNKWKGNLPKDIVEKRVRRILPKLSKNLKSHTVDAIGIGLYLKGEF